MGMFDTVLVPCPKCGTISDFQSKSGECVLDVYPLHEAPTEVLEDVNRHSPNTCEQCGTKFGVKLTEKPFPVLVTNERLSEILENNSLRGNPKDDEISRIVLLIDCLAKDLLAARQRLSSSMKKGYPELTVESIVWPEKGKGYPELTAESIVWPEKEDKDDKS